MSQVVTSHRSPNFSARPAGVLLDAIVMHCTEDDGNALSAVQWLCRPHGDSSAHVVIDRDGTIYDLVPVQKRAWHAGVSSFEGRNDVNNFSVGVELANKGNGEAYSDAQLGAAAVYCAGLIKEWPAITVDRITTHAIVALPPGRKHDPQAPFSLDAFKQLVAEELDR